MIGLRDAFTDGASEVSGLFDKPKGGVFDQLLAALPECRAICEICASCSGEKCTSMLSNVGTTEVYVNSFTFRPKPRARTGFRSEPNAYTVHY
jgi:hypothetical protein